MLSCHDSTAFVTAIEQRSGGPQRQARPRARDSSVRVHSGVPSQLGPPARPGPVA